LPLTPHQQARTAPADNWFVALLAYLPISVMASAIWSGVILAATPDAVIGGILVTLRRCQVEPYVREQVVLRHALAVRRTI
jgi:hypothetical protein